jgi:hypothetical protein
MAGERRRAAIVVGVLIVCVVAAVLLLLRSCEVTTDGVSNLGDDEIPGASADTRSRELAPGRRSRTRAA